MAKINVILTFPAIRYQPSRVQYPIDFLEAATTSRQKNTHLAGDSACKVKLIRLKASISDQKLKQNQNQNGNQKMNPDKENLASPGHLRLRRELSSGSADLNGY